MNQHSTVAIELLMPSSVNMACPGHMKASWKYLTVVYSDSGALVD
jgi:hypothetical protein